MKIKLLIFSLAIIFLFTLNSYCQTGSDIEQDFLNMRKYLNAIGTVVIDSTTIGNKTVSRKKFVTIGTGLSTYVKYDTTMLKSVITAGHVIKFFKQNNIKSIFIRPSWADTIKITDYYGMEIPLINEDKTPNTFLYPENNIDLGCVMVLPRYYDNVCLEKLKREHDPVFPFHSMSTPYIGTQVWVCGYPVHVESEIENRFMYSVSTFKPGYITWKPSTNMTNIDLNHITLIESNATYGNSGGPVFALREYTELVGIMVGGYLDIDSVYINSKPFIDTISKQPLIVKSRSGVSIIEKAEYVKYLLQFVESEILKFK